jgi:hypothetical protein
LHRALKRPLCNFALRVRELELLGQLVDAAAATAAAAAPTAAFAAAAFATGLRLRFA